MIHKHTKFQLPFYMGLSGIYIVVKYVLSPFLYAARLMGFRSKTPLVIDSAINRIILPLTEGPDEIKKNEIPSTLQTGNLLPELPVTLSDGTSLLLNNFTKSKLFLVFIRGSWCSYSRLHLSELISNRSNFEKAGVKILGVTSYRDQDWWKSKGVDIPMIIDENGNVFKQFGLLVNSWYEFTWGRVLPHEGIFLFDTNGKLLESDVRKISNLLPGQSFLSSGKWLEIVKKKM